MAALAEDQKSAIAAVQHTGEFGQQCSGYQPVSCLPGGSEVAVRCAIRRFLSAKSMPA